eukprot:TRINITY_DN4326_c0_g1_i1.p1 TRINITY_DN4326_c0_g1~~TRINITY_DN4326_c0_g1_i1.p1  ORF type:complete len:109 (-),score=15.55 TRINITY_DN4326_c0_g1_i1:90-416(-)
MLSEWEAQRTMMPERSYRLPKGAHPIKHGHAQSSYFSGNIYKNDKIYSREFQRKLAKLEEKHKHFGEHAVTSFNSSIFDKHSKGLLTDRIGKEFGWTKASFNSAKRYY